MSTAPLPRPPTRASVTLEQLAAPCLLQLSFESSRMVHLPSPVCCSPLSSPHLANSPSSRCGGGECGGLDESSLWGQTHRVPHMHTHRAMAAKTCLHPHSHTHRRAHPEASASQSQLYVQRQTPTPHIHICAHAFLIDTNTKAHNLPPIPTHPTQGDPQSQSPTHMHRDTNTHSYTLDSPDTHLLLLNTGT